MEERAEPARPLGIRVLQHATFAVALQEDLLDRVLQFADEKVPPPAGAEVAADDGFVDQLDMFRTLLAGDFKPRVPGWSQPDASIQLNYEKVIESVSKAASTGKIGDGKIFVLNVEQAVRIRTGESGNDAL